MSNMILQQIEVGKSEIPLFCVILTGKFISNIILWFNVDGYVLKGDLEALKANKEALHCNKKVT